MLKPKWKAFLEHPKHKQIRFDETFKRFALSTPNGEVTLPGLNEHLRDVYFPDYVYIRKSTDGTTGAGSIAGGMMRGQVVHEQLMDFANMSKVQFEKSYKDANVELYTKKAVLALREWGYKPMWAEVCVWNETIATRIDCIVTNKDGDFILIEWKTGMDNYFKRGSGPMKGVLKEKYSNSPLNQAHLQLLMSRMMIEREYGIEVDNQFVVHIHGNGVDKYPLPPTMEELKNTIYNIFVISVKSARQAQKIRRESQKKEQKRNRRRKKRTNKKFPKQITFKTPRR